MTKRLGPAAVVNIRNVDPEVARRFKADATLKGLTLAEYLKWLVQQRGATR
jgi:hypothetical protein